MYLEIEVDAFQSNYFLKINESELVKNSYMLLGRMEINL